MYRQSEKNLLNSNISPTSDYNMVNFGPKTAELRSVGEFGACTPANFNGFRVLAALLHGTLVVSVSQTAALNRGRHLYSAGRPSRWALDHILVYNLSAFVYSQTPSHCMKLTVLINHITDTAQPQSSNSVVTRLSQPRLPC